MHRIAFSIDDIDAALEIAAKHGCCPLRGVATYEDIYGLTYVRRPQRRPRDAGREAEQELDRQVETLAEFTSIGLPGFSQGGAIAVQFTRRAPQRFSRAALMSAFVLPDPVPTVQDSRRVRPPVLTAHGDPDDVIGADDTLRGLDWLRRHTTLTERVYPDLGHEVSDHLLEDSMRFVGAQLAR